MRSSRRGPGKKALHGFTIMELLVGVAVIGLLLGLSTPLLGKVRSRAMQAGTLSNLRQCGQVLSVYSADWRGSFPAFLDPSRTRWTIEVASQGVSIEIEKYFLGGMIWNVALADAYFDGRTTHEAFYPVEQASREGPGGMPFLLPCVYFADPAYWRLETRTGREQYRATFQHQVVHPANKTLLVGVHGLLVGDETPGPSAGGASVPSARADGSAGSETEADHSPGCASGEGVSDQSIHFFDTFVGLHTVGGVRGRDLR